MCSKSLRPCPTLCDPMDYSLPGSSVRGILQGRILEWVTMPSSRGSSQPRDWEEPREEPGSPALQADSLSAEPPGKPKNTGEGSLSLLQQIFPIQELNWGLLHCRLILYQLSYQGSPQRWTRKPTEREDMVPTFREFPIQLKEKNTNIYKSYIQGTETLVLNWIWRKVSERIWNLS